MNKICKVCGEFKWHKSWKTDTCEECISNGVKYCPSCESVLPLSSFYKLKSGLTTGFCKVCEKERSCASKREAYSKDPDAKYKERIRTHNRRCAKRANTYTVAEWFKTLEVFNNQCAYCGSDYNLTMDHVVPIIEGGTNTFRNIVPACKSCNSQKNSTDVVQWYTAQSFYSKDKLKRILNFVTGGEK
jgi:5-methylcytosine-specific restriction endonuclease McrA